VALQAAPGQAFADLAQAVVGALGQVGVAGIGELDEAVQRDLDPGGQLRVRGELGQPGLLRRCSANLLNLQQNGLQANG
jgi:hypothetical protein